jgi:hypothetical protein
MALKTFYSGEVNMIHRLFERWKSLSGKGSGLCRNLYCLPDAEIGREGDRRRDGSLTE